MEEKEKTFCELLDEAIEDEKKATPFYEPLMQKSEQGTKIPILSFIIEKIKKDEESHSEILKKIKETICQRDKNTYVGMSDEDYAKASA